jgi:hypothetical protein
MAGTDVTMEQITDVLGVASLGFGVAGVLAPTALRRAYGMSASSGELTYIGRMWGSRTAVLGALALAAETTAEQRRVAMLVAGMNAMDAVAAAGNTELPGRTRVMGAMTSGLFAAAAAYATTLD